MPKRGLCTFFRHTNTTFLQNLSFYLVKISTNKWKTAPPPSCNVYINGILVYACGYLRFAQEPEFVASCSSRWFLWFVLILIRYMVCCTFISRIGRKSRETKSYGPSWNQPADGRARATPVQFALPLDPRTRRARNALLDSYGDSFYGVTVSRSSTWVQRWKPVPIRWQWRSPHDVTVLNNEVYLNTDMLPHHALGDGFHTDHRSGDSGRVACDQSAHHPQAPRPRGREQQNSEHDRRDWDRRWRDWTRAGVH